MIKRCPKCGSDRPAKEINCEGDFHGERCNWLLISIPAVPWDALPPQVPDPSRSGRRCSRGHAVADGDFLCPVCGDFLPEIGDAPSEPPANDGRPADPEPMPSRPSLEIDGWRSIAPMGSLGPGSERHLVERVDRGQRGVLTLYGPGVDPDPDVYEKLRQVRLEQAAQILAFGHAEGRLYEVIEHIDGSSLRDLPVDPNDKDALRRIVEEIGRALDAFARIGLRHRDLRPEVILFSQQPPARLVISGFVSARLSEFDLDLVSAGETTRYMAPEAVLGGVAPASDWWSLGIILLEKLTSGACFEGVDDRAFLIHALTHGVALPNDLDPELQLLLRGLLARDRAERWQWKEVRAWLDGAPVEAPQDPSAPLDQTGPAIPLGGVEFRSPARYALAAAETATWNEARDHLVRGRLATWAEEIGLDPRRLAVLRGLMRRELDDDIRLSLALKALNPDLPLVVRGDIVTPGWLVQNPEAGYALVSGEAPDVLAQLETEAWLGQLKRRADSLRTRAAHHEIELDEANLRIYLLSTSRAKLRAEWEARRKVLPDTDHRGLAAIADRRQILDEDLIILLSATTGQFRTVDEIVAEARDLAKSVGVAAFDRDVARATVVERTRREIFQLVAERIADFAHCGIARIDEWAGEFRHHRRGPLARALVLLAVPETRWQRPAHQQYVGELISFFEQKIALSIKRGPLARMTIGRSSTKIDVLELGTVRRPAEAMVERIIDRSQQPMEIDPAVFADDPNLEPRLRSLHQHATLYKRDTGIDGLYLGFPFLIFQPTGGGVLPRIAPVLLWPIRINAEVGRHGFSVAFDTEREEVRLNPALEAFMGREAAQKWEDARSEELGRAARLGDIVDAFGHLASPRQRELVRLPGEGVKVPPGPGELVCSAVLFHVAFMGQAVLEDLGRLKHARLDDTALQTALRIAGEAPTESVPEPTKEIDRYLAVSSDPSQEAAVLSARSGRGLVVEGPPGTGKSQTIVNLVADAIGRKKSLLLVCQKHAALEVVRKRLEAEGLGNRMVMVTDVNKDRRTVIKEIREQVDEIFAKRPSFGHVTMERAGLATRIEALEQELDNHHRALHEIDPASGRSYRDLIGELVALEEGDEPPIDCLALREVVAGLDLQELAAVEEACAPLACDWLAAAYEGSPLLALNQFSWDTATRAAFVRDFDAFRQAEAERSRLLEAEVSAFKVHALGDKALERWIETVDIAQSESSFLGRLILRRFRARMRLRSHLPKVGAKLSESSVEGFHKALKSEKSLRTARAEAHASSLAALDRLARWFTPAWIAETRATIDDNRPNDGAIEALAQALPRLAAFQRFRARAHALTPQAWSCFAALREIAETLAALQAEAVEPTIRRILGREARLAWKARLETARPVLLLDRAQIEGKVRALAEADTEMRRLNRLALVNDIDARKLRDKQRWQDITRLQGPRMIRLREFVDRGGDLGLFEVRPVWLMNPDVASRLLPQRPGMFDIVVYDEASQMPVECALPTLFRGKTMIVSGDEKQLPPTSFFSTRVQSEEEASEADEPSVEATEEEVAAAEEVWNRREIKDCSDLLALGRSVLPPTMLEVHYRSQYRELIAYSNAAFYSNRLQVPIQHPDAEVKRVKPIEVVRVNGVYAAQTNSDEADAVVKLLGQYWRRPTRPSIGVVTFNRKQADLIEARLEARAEESERFRSAYAQELNRFESGEDKGFFVKNVENVQGDERDVIIFSTTFGRDQAGAFRRYFGVLGQRGGERRLNVAISRARQKVVVVTSMPVADISDMLLSGRPPAQPRDFLQGYLHYAEQVSKGSLGTARSALNQVVGNPARQPRTEPSPSDGFAATVTAYLRKLGYDPVPAQDETAFGLNFAIRHPKNGLFGIGIECDAPKHKLLERARAREIWRRGVLARSVPVVHRVSSHGWYYDRETEKRRLAEAVARALS